MPCIEWERAWSGKVPYFLLPLPLVLCRCRIRKTEDKGRRGQRKSVIIAPPGFTLKSTRQYLTPLHVPIRQPSSSRTQKIFSQPQKIFSQLQKIFSQPHLCHRATPPKTRHGKTLPYSDIKSTSSTAHCVPSQYPSTGLPQGLLPL